MRHTALPGNDELWARLNFPQGPLASPSICWALSHILSQKYWINELWSTYLQVYVYTLYIVTDQVGAKEKVAAAALSMVHGNIKNS